MFFLELLVPIVQANPLRLGDCLQKYIMRTYSISPYLCMFWTISVHKPHELYIQICSFAPIAEQNKAEGLLQHIKTAFALRDFSSEIEDFWIC